MTAFEYAKEKLFGPLGITDLYWWHDPQGITDGGFGLFLQPRDMAKIGYLYLRNGVWDGKQLLPSTWIDKVNHATIDMHLGYGLRYSNCFWAIPEKHVYMADGYRGQVIMVFPDLDVVAVTTGRANFSLADFVDLISKSVKSDKSLASDAGSAELLANKIHEASAEKPTQVGPSSKTASVISGKLYRFPPNRLNLKSFSLFLTGSDQRYEIEAYPSNGTNAGQRFTGPIGLDGLYRKGDLTEQGANNPLFAGMPRVHVVNALKGTWMDDRTFVVDWRMLGLANAPEERWTLSFNGDKLNVWAQFVGGPEISTTGETGQ